ncbi:PREDICTED: F-BAR domain only protein 2-like [Amphimedon queenslandica]|uniref:MHD domain-containing protein n=1 Tax=Amphimedon queenslandica TaxID=400682 RepID=A0A1X7SLW9_AMPQE|nr:PREDICTED: F-BAR domain only protein 2-like [Amphimedon queenslandica]|eukprot:XP_011409207.2 PREDICTED: F-BAR domain only protein 2-like [Amphimedon queenslandica]
MTSFWKCESSSTVFRLDYTYTPDVFPSKSKPNLTNLSATITVGGGVTSADPQPKGAWSDDKSTMVWKLPDVSSDKEIDTCTIRSRFEVSSGPTVPTPALIQFMCDGSTLSGVAMAVENPAYKISLHKNKCFSGKYMAEPIK